VLGPIRTWRGDIEIDCGPPALHCLEHNPTGELNCQVQLGDIRRALGDQKGARELCRTALTELHLPQADAVCQRLSTLDGD
jgi:hypothetical protein